MIITCPECAGKLKVPESASGKKVRCPGCQAVVVIPPSDEETYESQEPEDDGEEPEFPPNKRPTEKLRSSSPKKKKKKPEPTAPDKRLLIGVAAAGVILIGALGVFLARGFGSKAPKQI